MGGHSLRTVDEHQAAVRALLAAALQPRTEIIGLAHALGRRTAQPVVSPVDLPLFRNAQMDGFAVRAADLADAGATLPIVGEAAARPGEALSLPPGSAIRIMTGAPVPHGADAVIPIEQTEATGDTVTIRHAVRAGTFVRESGSDLRSGERILPALRELGPRHLAALAAAGIRELSVIRKPRILVISTGSELVPYTAMPGPGQVHDANAIALESAIRLAGAEIADSVWVADDPARLAAVLAEATPAPDLVVTSGGISEGAYEVVRQVIEPLGGWVGHVAMQPGGPQATATVSGIPLLGFPGNPVSTQISFEVFLAPLLREAAGLPAARRLQCALAAPVHSVPGKRQFLRGRLLDDGRVEAVAGPGSHLVAAMASADALIDVPRDVTELAAGASVEVWVL